MQTDFINQIIPTPKLKTTKCKIVSFLLRIFLQFTSFIVALVTWYMYDYFIAAGLFFLSFIIMGIIHSKLRNSVIPKAQQEYQYNAKGIADWYTAHELCIEIESKKKEHYEKNHLTRTP